MDSEKLTESAGEIRGEFCFLDQLVVALGSTLALI
jgi:hypothetical protein